MVLKMWEGQDGDLQIKTVDFARASPTLVRMYDDILVFPFVI
jgi:hypothetical protein